MKKYGILLLVTLATGLVLARLGVSARGTRSRETPAVVERDTTLVLAVANAGVSPAASAVPKGTRVRLVVAGLGDREVRLSLAGYEDRVSITVAPGDTARTDFAADRPGEDFAWLVDGKPAGRLAVTGSHLVEGHR